MIGYLILVGFLVLAILTLFALSVPSMRKRETKLIVSLIVAVLAASVYVMYTTSLWTAWWAWVLIGLGLVGGTVLSVFVETREKKHQAEVPQRMVN